MSVLLFSSIIISMVMSHHLTNLSIYFKTLCIVLKWCEEIITLWSFEIIVDYIAAMSQQREEEIKSNISKDVLQPSRFFCDICQFSASSRHKVFCHLEAKHFQDPTITYPCEFCGRVFSTKNACGVHMSKKHRGMKQGVAKLKSINCSGIDFFQAESE